MTIARDIWRWKHSMEIEMETFVRKCMVCGVVFGCTITGKKYLCYDCAKPCDLCDDNHCFDITTGICEPCLDEVKRLRDRRPTIKW